MAPRDNNPLAPALAAGGALLLLISMLLSWYSIDISGAGQSASIDVARPDTGTLLLIAAIGVAIYFAIVRFRGGESGHGGLLMGLAVATLLYVVINLIKKPQFLDLITSTFDEVKSQAQGQLPSGTDIGVGIGPGLWIALVGSLLLLAAGLAALGVIGGSGGGTRAASPGGLGTGGPAGPTGGATAVQPTEAAPGGAGGAGGAGAGAPAPADRTAGWKPDPYGQAQMRYWDGNSWTEHTG
jgi:hypothetical protein